ncbi:MAG TPA: hypothetical protein EYN70_14055 [Planctomycetaceae bacterium]|nr:hypothetical protein [Planctomycetaceae bacterium]
MNPVPRMLLRIGRLVALLAVLPAGELFLGGASLQGQEPIRWKFRPGTDYRVSFQQQTASKTRVGDQVIEVRLQMTMQMDWRVLQVDTAGRATMDQSFTRIRIELDNPKVESVVYDSSASEKAAGEAAQMAASLGPLIGKPFRVVMTNRGVVQKVELSPQAQVALNRVPEESRLKDVFTTAGLTQTLQKSHGILPLEAVQPGDQWEVDSMLVTPLGALKMKTKYQYVANLQRSGTAAAQLKVHGQIELLPGEDQDSPPQQLKIKSQDMSGEVFFDKAQGRLLESKMTQRLVTESEFRDLLLSSQMTSSLVTTVTVIKKR